VSASIPPIDEEAAALWFARCRRGVMTLEERVALEAWRLEPANAAAFAQLERVWESLQVAQAHFEPEGAPAPAARRLGIARSALLAVMCAVFLGIGVISYSGNSDFWTNLDWVDR
jgi:ferric-dicitrate binding protein FerR (iron transport regulator)